MGGRWGEEYWHSSEADFCGGIWEGQKARMRKVRRVLAMTQGPGEESRTRLVTVEKRRREGGKDSEGRKLVMVT